MKTIIYTYILTSFSSLMVTVEVEGEAEVDGVGGGSVAELVRRGLDSLSSAKPDCKLFPSAGLLLFELHRTNG